MKTTTMEGSLELPFIATTAMGIEHMQSTLRIRELVEAAASCDGARLQMLGLAMALTPNGQGRSEGSTELFSNPSNAVGAITEEQGGLTHAKALGSRVMVLPAEGRSSQEYMERALQELFEAEGGNNDWILDFSAITHLPLLFLGTLYAYKQDLEQHGRSLYIAWLSPGALSPHVIKLTTDAFNLTQVGHALFSKTTAGTRYYHGS